MEGDDQAIIGAGARLRGTIRGSEPLRIEGRVDGRVELEATLTVEASGVARADLVAREIVIAGIVVGDVEARERLVVLPTAQIRGALTAPRLRMEPGARVDGPLRIAVSASAEGTRPRPVVVSVAPLEEPAPGEEDGSGEERRTRVVVKKRP